ncbi:primosomal replication protein PriC [Colwellia sp. RSH04]|uniref:primosomal replication protein PriC n=1 Tax=Colwellia sp. RSH04 TaxID=2305464 RepID=UPI000E58C06C|nr:primosomal replication protein PriC [Colwellia sp. RSH04]RHW75620.1 primosomal replication protein N'' [Colwellia sp. RSH04]
MTLKNQVDRLSHLFEHLTLQAKLIDKENTANKSHYLIENSNLFTKHLFQTDSDMFSDYVDEAKSRLDVFIRLSNKRYSKAKMNDERLQHLLNHLEQQISAIHNAFSANNSLHQVAKLSFDAHKKARHKRIQRHQANQPKLEQLAQSVMMSSHQLYQQLSEHHEFERRLLLMVNEREEQRRQCNNQKINTLSAEVLALHQRLGRCRKAISAIERKIEFSEKSQ